MIDNKRLTRMLVRVTLCIVFVFGIVIATGSPTFAIQTKQESVSQRKLILVVGASGKAEYGVMFADWASRWEATASAAGFDVARLGGKSKSDSTVALEALQQQIESAHQIETDLWIVMIGHGTFDGAEAKFNLPGQDVAAAQMNEWLNPRTGLTVIINCSSASGPFCDLLKGPNRIVLASTRNGYEFVFSQFGRFMAEAISEAQVDLDKDQQTSLLEAAIVAHGKTAEFYKSDSRLATEHAVIEDNGDGKGTPLDWFTGTRVSKQAKDGTPADGLRANQVFLKWNETTDTLTREQVEKRNRLEQQIDALRTQKKNLTEDQYFAELEKLMLQVARLHEKTGQVPNR